MSEQKVPGVSEATREPEIPEFWRCFHCEFHTNIREEAEAHFGERDDAEEFKPICKWWANMDEAERREQLQDSIRDLRHLQDELGRSETREKALEFALRLVLLKSVDMEKDLCKLCNGVGKHTDDCVSKVANDALSRKG